MVFMPTILEGFTVQLFMEDELVHKCVSDMNELIYMYLILNQDTFHPSNCLADCGHTGHCSMSVTTKCI